MENTKEQASMQRPYLDIINDNLKIGQISSALFDFDGTISVIREGWQNVMVPLMIEILSETPNCEDAETLEVFVREMVAVTTGIDTIYQMIGLAEEVKKRGGEPKDPMEYKKEYLRRLWERIEHRVDALKSGKVEREEMVVEGAIEMLDYLKEREVVLYVASGTDHKDVVAEAEALGVAKYFGDRIYGALDNYWERSKAKIIKQILEENNLHGNSLVVFGDGFVEIENAKAVGGIAVGVASDEEKRKGMNEWKRERLVRAGADIIIPDFTNVPSLTAFLFPS